MLTTVPIPYFTVENDIAVGVKGETMHPTNTLAKGEGDTVGEVFDRGPSTGSYFGLA